MDFVYVIVHWLLVIEWVLVQREMIISNQIFRIFELRLEKIYEKLRRDDKLVVLYLWVDQQFIEQFRDLALKVLLIDLLDLVNGNFAFITPIRKIWPFTMPFYLLSDILRQFQLVNIYLPLVYYPCCDRTSFELLHGSLLLFIVDLFQLLKDLFVELVLNELSTNKGIRLNVLVVFYFVIDSLNLQGLFIQRLFLHYLLLI